MPAAPDGTQATISRLISCKHHAATIDAHDRRTPNPRTTTGDPRLMGKPSTWYAQVW